ncbi:hypothetical protein ACTMNU_12780 [Staphylococcus pseudintermedius]
MNSTVLLLLDEMEKLMKRHAEFLLAILDEGIVRYNEVGADGYMITHEISLKKLLLLQVT